MTDKQLTTNRADGYMTAIGYTYDYYPELNPLHMRLGLLMAGFAAPDVRIACELGCGQGVSLVIHAAASRVRWFGTDVNREHVDFARTMAQAGGVDARLFDESFADFVQRTDLPEFDFMALHGVWSWINEENRRAIVEFARQRLKPGGVLFVSYNALPGSASFGPVRHLLAEHARMGSGGGTSVDRVEAAIAFAERLASLNAGYLQDNPRDAKRLAKLRHEDRRYLAHEYFSKDWTPMHFSAVAERLADAGLRFACSAFYFEAVEALNLGPAQRSLLAEIEDPIFRQTVRDFLVNQRFRLDYWIRGGARLAAGERLAALREERVVLIRQRPELPPQIRAVLALNLEAPREATAAAIACLLADHRSRTLGEIEMTLPDVPFDDIVAAVALLAAYRRLAPAQDERIADQVREGTDKLNAWLLGPSVADKDLRHLASPVTGGGIRIESAHRHLLSALRHGEIGSGAAGELATLMALRVA